MSNKKVYLEYPKSIFCIIATEFCERFSFCGLRTILSLYLRNVLLFPENTSTIIYHVFIMLCYLNPIVGALFADSILGRYRTILYFSEIYFLGSIIMCLAATPPLELPADKTTYIGLLLIAIGTGGIKPCVAAFGGDQFSLPQQDLELQRFFSLFYFTINMGGFVGMILTPILRNSVTCFGEDTCYSLGFGFPAFLMLLALIMFVSGKPWYSIKIPKDNIILNFSNCVTDALIQKIKTPNIKSEHWLDYSKEKHGIKLVNDIKTVLSILYLFIPLPIFWSLFDQQGSRWTFQASRMNGKLFGFEILPDQMQVVNPVIVLLLIPIFDKCIYPTLEACGGFLVCPLKRMIFGGFIAALAFIASGLLELQLEESYPVSPKRGEASIRFINTLPCSVTIVNPFNGYQYLDPTGTHIFHKIPVVNGKSSFNVVMEAPEICQNHKLNMYLHTTKVYVTEKKVGIVVIGVSDVDEVRTYVPELADFSKALSGKSRLRTTFLNSSPYLNNVTVTVQKSRRNFQDIYFVPNWPKEHISTTAYIELSSGSYGCMVRVNGNLKYQTSLKLEVGGVYLLIFREYKGIIEFGHLYIMTPPNTVHMIWLLPQYFLISVAEIMFAIPGLEFSFTQAPKCMKTITIAAWYLSVALGNCLVIFITQAKLFDSQAHEFLLYAVLTVIDMLVFKKMARNYKFVSVIEDPSSEYHRMAQESIPLLNF